MFKFHSFLPFIKFWLVPMFGMFFAAGATSIGGGEGAAVLDGALPDAGGEADGEGAPEDQGGEGAGASGEHTDPDAEGAETDDATVRTAAAATKPGMTPEIAKALETLPPNIAKQIKAKLYSGQQAEKSLFTLKKDFPNGVADVMKLKQAIDTTLGGVKGIAKIGEDVRTFRELDRKWEAKDPTLVDSLANEYPEEFSAMVPHFINKFADKAPEAYSKMYAGMVVSQLNVDSIPQSLYMLNEYLAAAAEMPAQSATFIAKAADLVGKIHGWMDSLGKQATAPLTAKPAAGSSDKDNKTAEIDRRETAQFNREVSFDYNTFRDNLIGSQLDELLTSAKKTLDGEKREVVIERALKKLSMKMNADPDFRETVQQYEKAKDREGLVKFLKSRAGAALKGQNGKTGLVSLAYQSIFGEVKLGGGGKKKEGDGGAGGGKGNSTPGSGWIKLAKMPQVKDISRRLTEAEGLKQGLSYEQMVMKNKYVLNDGRKVFHD